MLTKLRYVRSTTLPRCSLPTASRQQWSFAPGKFHHSSSILRCSGLSWQRAQISVKSFATKAHYQGSKPNSKFNRNLVLPGCIGLLTCLAVGGFNLSTTSLEAATPTTAAAGQSTSTGLEPPSSAKQKPKRLKSKASSMRRMRDNLRLFSGNANVELAQAVAEELGIRLGHIHVGRFADGEVSVTCHENVRGKDVYIVQPTCAPANENLMELLLMVSTMRRASARRITAVIPYYGYARQDRKDTARVPISAADVARLLEAMGVDRVIAVDLHCGQIQGFFGPQVPVDNLAGGHVGVDYFASKYHEDKTLQNPVIVSPDAGGVARAKRFREELKTHHGIDAGLAMIIKQRKRAGEIASMDLVGSVEGSDVIIVDDMIDTAGTLTKAANEIKNFGAQRVFAFASHGLFNGPASSRIEKSALEEVVVVNTVPLRTETKRNEKITQLTIAPLLAETIQRIHEKKSVSEIFTRHKNGKSS